MKITSHTLAPDVQNFFVGYDSGIAVLRRTCRKYPGVRRLVKAKNTIQYDNLLKIYLTILLDTTDPQGTDLPWAALLARGSLNSAAFTVLGAAPHEEQYMEKGMEFPSDCLGLFLSSGSNCDNSLIVAGEIRILRWCNMRAVPTMTTHTHARSAGLFLKHTEKE